MPIKNNKIYNIITIAENSFTLLVSNVRMDNDDKESFYAIVKKYNPDILLITEPDQSWGKSLLSK